MNPGHRNRLAHPYDLTFNYQKAYVSRRFQRQPVNIISCYTFRQVHRDNPNPLSCPDSRALSPYFHSPHKNRKYLGKGRKS
jgi:hypothetical protein